MGQKFFIPDQIIFGKDALEDSKDIINTFGHKALIVTGSSRTSGEYAKQVTEVLEALGVAYTVFNGISGEPTDRMITDGVTVYRQEQCDFLIGIGGGSPLDAMKAIAILAAKGGEIADYLGKEVNESVPPMVAIPTTAGTGSEATQFTIVTDTKTQVKMLLKGSSFMPTLAVVDPRYTISMPQETTVATGMDALTHAVEAYTSRKAQPLSDNFAISAVKRIFAYLSTAFHDGRNTEAREQMALAALEAGIAFNNSSVTLVHGMSRPIGALFHVPHGLSNTMLIKECLNFALEGAYERFGELGRQIGAADKKDSDKEASEKFLQAISDLCRECQVPTLEEYGIDREEFFGAIEKMAEDAIKSGSPSNTKKPVVKDELVQIYKSLWNKGA
ncbi:iron-containing alcohol dehydrogenase [Clostridium aminobutyricum]|uniref:Iron-containing alcohol dehydrogenase n=1 Tax=Clostridium aminobutyricum TaxID=33953 RepID=A0A939DA93_CLOAM|nr:iron-containing alcohol dehydrogenase [Clostridium aminobutyricum]MBN7773633.1 iron-containing alcohol dehydrogenase [Clostridium aminobutyricum]